MSIQTHSIQSGGVTLFAKESGNSENPALLFLHGFPDDQNVWSYQFEHFSKTHHVISFDLRGMGQSTAPTSKSEYKLSFIMEDIRNVIEYFCGENKKVHLAGHDWGSAIGWQFAADPAYSPQFIESYVSLSCPHVGVWNALSLARFKSLKMNEMQKAMKQYLKSWYIGFFQLPMIPEQILKDKAGAITRYLLTTNGVSKDDPYLEETFKAGFNQAIINGLELYRSNIFPPVKAPEKNSIDLPILQLVPTKDKFLSPSLYESKPDYCNDFTLVEFEADHWAQREMPEKVISEMEDFYKKLTANT